MKRASDKFARKMKELERYLGATYSYRCQLYIKTETPEKSPDPDMPTITPDTGFDNTNTDTYMTYLEKKNTDKAIYQKLRKKYVHETDMHKI